MLGPKKIFSQKNLNLQKLLFKYNCIFGLIKFWVLKELFGTEKLWYQQNLGLRKILLPKKFWALRKFCVQKLFGFGSIKLFLGPIRFLAMKEFRCRKNSCPKKVLVQQNFGAKEITGLKNFWKKIGLKKFGFKRNFRSKKFVWKNFGFENYYGLKKILGLRKNFSLKKNFGIETNFVSENFLGPK